MNWRTPLLTTIISLSQATVRDELKWLKVIESNSAGEIQHLHKQRLHALLRHAWETTDYYHDVLQACGVVKDGTVNLDRFEEIPFLTKDIIREQKERLYAKVLPAGRKAFHNSSGGSTGQAVEFRQDNVYWDINVATKLYHFWTFGKQPGDPELKVWGSEFDLIKGSESLQARLTNWLYNRRSQQCFHLPQVRIENIVKQMNKFKPKIIWAYRDGIDVIAKYINKNAISMHQPAAVILGGGTIYPYIIEEVKKALGAPVISMYGSREMGDVGCQCEWEQGLHIAMNSHKVEVIDQNDHPVIGEDGELAITSLHNYAMPFIRYKIGDRGKLLTTPCPCGRAFPVMSPVSGRVIEALVNSQGETVDAIYFIQLFGVYFYRKFVHRFQVVQEDYNFLLINIVLEQGVDPSQATQFLQEIEKKIKVLMGENCRVQFDFVSQIPLTPSGKHPYVLRKVPLTKRV
jgi:phenylacetate-CoA ligase